MQGFTITNKDCNIMCKDNTKIAILSGKGGTGKTLVGVNLAAIHPSTYIDCDVEEPNGNLFFKAAIDAQTQIAVNIPIVDGCLCTGCKQCVQFCKFNALAYAGGKVIVMDEICHSCGGCMLVCKPKAISEIDKRIGTISAGKSGDVSVIFGTMDTGIASGIPIIKTLMTYANKASNIVIIDCPPGSSCAVIESISDTDYCLLVAEPTVFGQHNLDMVYNLVKLLGKPCGVVLNKCTPDTNPSKDYCVSNGIPILAEIPYDKELALLNSYGKIAAHESKRYRQLFAELLDNIKEAVL